MSTTASSAPLLREVVPRATSLLNHILMARAQPFSAIPARSSAYGYLFPQLQEDPAALLPESPDTPAFLTRLANTFRDPGTDSDPALGLPLQSEIPSAYTYFGQFIDHDITREDRSSELADLADPGLVPLSRDVIQRELSNARSASLDLDSIYDAPAPRDGDEMRLGRVSPNHGPDVRPTGRDDWNDLPRQGESATLEEDRKAEIGDSRNDENLIVAQLHVAFLRAHNALVRQGHTFDEARTLLRQHYQWITLQDFLRRLVDPTIVDRILTHGNQFYDALAEPFYMPLEFSAAVFRFGHSMVRPRYDYNVNFSDTHSATLMQLFTFTALSGNFNPAVGVSFPTLPEHWIIEWSHFLEAGTNKARRLDPLIADPLLSLTGLAGGPAPGLQSLAARNLLRGYLLRIPTGQAVAGALGLPPLSKNDLFQYAQQPAALQNAGFLTATPLWYYVLAEASLAGGSRLGPVGGTIVAEVLIGLVRRSADSILAIPGWRPTLNGGGDFKLADLLQLAAMDEGLGA